MYRGSHFNDPVSLSSSDEDSTRKALLLQMQRIANQQGSPDDNSSLRSLGGVPQPLPIVNRNNKTSGNQVSSPYNVDRMALEQVVRSHLRYKSTGALSVRKDPDVFVQNNSRQQESWMNRSYPNLSRNLFDLEPTPISPQSILKVKRQHKVAQKRKNDISFMTLNGLMERTAKSRCLLLQQTKRHRRTASHPSMRSLSNSAFRTIVSSTKITSSTSARSFRDIYQDTNLSTSDRINSSFESSGFGQHARSKTGRSSAGINSGILAPTRRSLMTAEDPSEQYRKDIRQMAPLNSLPSCGSLESDSSEIVHISELGGKN